MAKTRSAFARLLERLFATLKGRRSLSADGKLPIDPAWMPIDLSRCPVDMPF